MTSTPRKPRALGPVHLYPEPSKKLAAGSPVADARDPRRFGRVKSLLPGGRFLVAFEDGETSPVVRADLLSRFTSETPKPRTRKAAA